VRAPTTRRSLSRRPGQPDQNRVWDVETNRPQLNDDATVDERNPLDAMRLRVVEPNNITRHSAKRRRGYGTPSD
jgi:hypothetical protein